MKRIGVEFNPSKQYVRSAGSSQRFPPLVPILEQKLDFLSGGRGSVIICAVTPTSMIPHVLGFEIIVVPSLLMTAVLLQFLARRSGLRGLLRAKDGSGRISWTRAQFLVAVLLTAGYLAFAIWASPTGRSPGLSSFWIYLMVASSAVYLVREACGRALSKLR